ncbi:Uma2 family endonuclease [Nodosilinea nodulosa]|uniref:Uma2 family endonuclease n=1 Tax=Nodosilinea nodulosa TaxID=416001 RepID=UPI0002E7F6F2|nr:Uma2 family endonuclease [Nodosilinea nodulosa]
MVQTKSNTATFADYLAYDDGTDTRYELVRGQLVAMTPPAWSHIKIARFLEDTFRAEIRRLGYSWDAIRGEIGQRTGEDDSRLPDVLVAESAALEALGDRPAVLEVPAVLTVEIVSRSSVQDDYLHKLAEYESLGVQEYWLVDYLALGPARYLGTPKRPTVFIYRLVDGEYAAPRQCRDAEIVESAIFPDLKVTAQEIFG